MVPIYDINHENLGWLIALKNDTILFDRRASVKNIKKCPYGGKYFMAKGSYKSDVLCNPSVIIR